MPRADFAHVGGLLNDDDDDDDALLLSLAKSTRKRKDRKLSEPEEDDFFNNLIKDAEKTKKMVKKKEEVEKKTNTSLGDTYVSKETLEALVSKHDFTSRTQGDKVDVEDGDGSDDRIYGAIAIFTYPQEGPRLSFQLPSESSASSHAAYDNLFKILSKELSNGELSDIVQDSIIQQWLRAKQLPPTGRLLLWLLKLCAFHPLNEIANGALLVLQELADDLCPAGQSSTPVPPICDALAYQDIKDVLKVFGACFLADETEKGLGATKNHSGVPEVTSCGGELLNFPTFLEGLVVFLERPSLHHLDSSDLSSLCVDLARAFLDLKTHSMKRGVPALHRCMSAAIAAFTESDWQGHSDDQRAAVIGDEIGDDNSSGSGDGGGSTGDYQGRQGSAASVAMAIDSCLDGVVKTTSATGDDVSSANQIFARVQLLRSVPVNALPSRNGELCIAQAHLLLKNHVLKRTAYGKGHEHALQDGFAKSAGGTFELMESALYAIVGEVPPAYGPVTLSPTTSSGGFSKDGSSSIGKNASSPPEMVPAAMRLQRDNDLDYTIEYSAVACIDRMLQVLADDLDGSQLAFVLEKVSQIQSNMKEVFQATVSFTQDLIQALQTRYRHLTLEKKRRQSQLTLVSAFQKGTATPIQTAAPYSSTS